MTDLTGNLFFDGPAGRIEATLKEPVVSVERVAIVCHPHPLFGGTMHNKVVYRIARAFHRAGFAVLRFNFRGAGRSEGEHDNGRGERADLKAAIRFMMERYDRAALWLSGFSFGAAVMLEVGCEDTRARALVAAGLPVSEYDLGTLTACDKPKLIVQGSLDQFGSPADLNRLFARLSEPKRVAMIEGADHFFEGHLDEMERAVSDFVMLKS